MPIWLMGSLGIAALLASWLGVQYVGAAIDRKHLRKLFANRNAEVALASAIACFPSIAGDRVVMAYRWVQALVDFDSPPILPSDDLGKDLRIDQGEADNRFECSHEWLGDSPASQGKAYDGPVNTVRDLMEEVLSYGYEGYPH